MIRYLSDICSSLSEFLFYCISRVFYIYLARYTIFYNSRKEWYLLQTIWIDLRHAIEKRSKKFDTMEVKIYSHTWNLIWDIAKSPCTCIIFIGRNIRTRVCKVCPTCCVLLKTMQATIFFERWVNPHVVASFKNCIHEIKRIWFFAAYEFNSIITLMFIKVYLKWVGLWCLDITLILPNM